MFSACGLALARHSDTYHEWRKSTAVLWTYEVLLPPCLCAGGLYSPALGLRTPLSEEEGARHGCPVEHLIKGDCATDEHAQCSAQEGPGCREADHIVIFIFSPKNNSKRDSKSISEAHVLESHIQPSLHVKISHWPLQSPWHMGVGCNSPSTLRALGTKACELSLSL